MRDREGTAFETFAVAAFATALFLGAARAFFSTIYYRNLTTLGLNASVLNALLLLLPLAYVLPAVHGNPRRTLLAAAGALAALRVAASALDDSAAVLPLAGLAAAAFLVLLPALARAASANGHVPAVAGGLAAGLALDATLAAVAGSRDPTAGLAGAFLAAALGVALVLAARRIRVPADGSGAPRGGAAFAGVALGAWLFLEFAVLAAPFHVARWNDAPLPGVAFASVAGLVAGIGLLARPSAAPRGALLLAGNAAILAFLLDHGFVGSALVPALLALAQAGMVLNLAFVLDRLGRAALRPAGLAAAAGALVLLVLLFSFAFAFQFAFVPLTPVWQDHAPHFLLAAFGLVLLAALPVARAGLRAAAPSPRALAPLLVLPLLAAGAVVLPGEPVDDPRAGGALRVLSFNVHQGFDNGGRVDPEVFLAVVRAADADVVLLQESDTPRFTSANLDLVHILAREAGYHAWYGPATREQNVGLALLSRVPILVASHEKLPSSSDNRFVLAARLLVNGSSVGLVGVHMGLPTPDREAQIAAILAKAATLPEPRILLGDFNSCPEGTCLEENDPPDSVYAKITAAYRDAWVAAGRDALDPAGRTYDAATPHARIDYVFVSPGVRVVAAGPVTTPEARAASDHLPLLADLHL